MYRYDPIRLKQAGFTLVELAIVLLIIGLLILGVLRGQEMIHNAKITATIQQVKSYMGAQVSFRDTYGFFPGDLPNADARLPGCQAGNTNFCGNGDGDGIVGTPIANNSININQAGLVTLPQIETNYYWKHLVLAGLIAGVNGAADPANAVWADGFPAGKLGFGFTAYYMLDRPIGAGVTGDKGIGLGLRLQKFPTSTGREADGGQPTYAVMLGRDAFLIDSKMDDGLGDSGMVTGDHEDWGCDPLGVYRTDIADPRCILYFEMN